MGDVVPFTGDTRQPIPPEAVLNGALEAQMTDVMVLGWGKTGDFYIASSTGDLGELLLLIELAKAEIMAQALA